MISQFKGLADDSKRKEQQNSHHAYIPICTEGFPPSASL